MGTVYKAVDPLIERTVAIKTIKLDLSKEELAEFEERFYREAKSAGRLNHSNIVTIYDVGETGDIAYIAMEYLEGESLREKLDSGVVLPIEMIVGIAAGIASALDYAHENNVVHRDIKPANIMITPNHDVKIMDFGIAQIPTGSRTQLGTVLGSPKYMAPEQVEGLATDGRTDIFALGVVLYEMLTGTTPFNGDNLSAILHKILNENPAPPSSLNPRVPPVFDRIISRALAKRPEDRYPSARAFAGDLRSHGAVLPGEVERPISSSKPAADKVRSNRMPAGPQDATLLLSPDKARQVLGASPTGATASIQEKATSFLWGGPLGRKPLVLALSLLAIVAWGLVSQRSQPKLDPVPVTISDAGEETTHISTPQTLTAPTTEVVAPLSAPAISPAPAKPAPGISIAVVPKAVVSFAISPWGDVFVDGRNVGASPPLTSLQLDAGKHKIEIRNQAFASYRDTVNLEPGQSLKIRHKFR